MNETMDLVRTASEATTKGLRYRKWLNILKDKSLFRLQPLQPILAEKVYEGLTRWELYEKMPVYDMTNKDCTLNISGYFYFQVLDRGLMDNYLSRPAGF